MKYLKPLIFILLILSGILLYYFTPLKNYLVPQKLILMLQAVQEEWWLPIVLILVYGFGGLIALPAVPLTLVIGAVYGLGEGMIYNTLAANLGAAVDFLAARYLGRDFVQKLLKGKWKEFDEKAATHGFRLILYLRLVPLFPFLGINFAAGLSKIGFRDYTAATVIGMIPGTFVYTYFASSLLAGVVEVKKEAVFHLVLSSLLFILLSLIPVFYKKLKK